VHNRLLASPSRLTGQKTGSVSRGQRLESPLRRAPAPGRRQDAKGQRICSEYDKALRLTAPVNENNATYRFAYDA